MKKLAAILAAMVLAALPVFAASSHFYLNGATTVGRSDAFVNSNSARVVSVHVWCDPSTTCSGNVDVEVANATDEPPYRAARISNPSGTGEVWFVNGKVIYLNLSSAASGTYFGTIQE